MNNQQDNSVKQQDTFRIIGKEDRKPHPNSAEVRLEIEGKDAATGFLYNKTTIIAAAHNIYSTTKPSNDRAKS